jgi:YbgC/YbaW family acyl-CoA thioester hydrolase
MSDATALRRFRIQEYVRWSDVDASGIIRWTTYPRFFELAETELFRAIGFPYADLWERLDIWLPRVQVHFDMRSPARLDDLIDIDVWTAKIGRSSIRLEFALRKAGGQLVAEGYLVVVSIDRGSGEPVQVPRQLADALARFGASAT